MPRVKKSVFRKCSICGIEFDINNIEYLKINKKYVETSCYITNEYGKGLDEITIQEKIKIIKKSMELELNKKREIEIEKERKKLLAKQSQVNREEERYKLVKWIQENYNINTLPKITYIKLSNINNGNFKDLNEGITYEDLLCMFQKKKNYLDKVADKNNRTGKEMNGLQRLNYDLAILVNLYDGYKQWKEKQKVNEANLIVEENKKENEIKIDYTKIKPVASDESDISNIIDDLY